MFAHQKMTAVALVAATAMALSSCSGSEEPTPTSYGPDPHLLEALESPWDVYDIDEGRCIVPSTDGALVFVLEYFRPDMRVPDQVLFTGYTYKDGTADGPDRVPGPFNLCVPFADEPRYHETGPLGRDEIFRLLGDGNVVGERGQA